jgi:CubicO group peptidase (beta-lactamase class C family)
MTFADVHDVLAARVSAGRIPGAVTLLARDDDVTVDAIGTTEFGGGEPLARDTVFRIASLTKPIVGTAAMMLVDDGTLALDQPVADVLPELGAPRVLRAVDGPIDDTVPADRPITVGDLLTYRMGHGILEQPTFNPPVPINNAAREQDLVLAEPDPRTPHRPDEWIKRFGALPLMYQPGERWQYNSSGLVLGVLVARAGGGSLEDVLAKRVFAPLDMSSTGFWLPAERLSGLPKQFMTNFGTGVMEEQTITGTPIWTRPPAFPSGASGLLSTVDDYYAFARFMRDGRGPDGRRLLSEDSLAGMRTNHLTAEQIAGGGMILGGRGWGFSQSVTVVPDEISATPGRYGWEGGSGTSWFNDPTTGVTAILLTQVSDVLFDGTLAEFGAAANAT